MTSDPAGGADGARDCYRHPGRPTYIRCRRCQRPICPDCMVDASVGFQCPSCVTGAKARPIRGSYGQRLRRDRGPQTTTLVIVALNVLVWAAIMATGQSASRLVPILGLALRGRCVEPSDPQSFYPMADRIRCAAAGLEWTPGTLDGAWWQPLTSAFTHISPVHLAFNMVAIYALGPALESMIGRARFLAVYVISALVASGVVLWLSHPYATTVGASGALFGLMAAVLVVVWHRGGDTRSILGWIGANAIFTVLGGAIISWQGHLGGFVGGLAAAAAIVFPGGRRRSLQLALLIALAVVALVLIVARAFVA